MEGRVIFLPLLLNDLYNNMNAIENEKIYMNAIENEKKFLLSYLQLDGNLQQEVKDRMKVVYALLNPSTADVLFASDLVSQRFKDMYLQQLRKHNRRLETILKMDDVPIYEASEFEAILEDFIKNE